MNAYLQKLIGTAALGLALVSNSLPAWAGYKSTYEVELRSNLRTPSAGGSMVDARYSADNIQYIGCSFSNTNGPFVMCSAKDKTGKYHFCTSTRSEVAAIAKTITDFSYIAFAVDNHTSPPVSCAYLYVWNGSLHLR